MIRLFNSDETKFLSNGDHVITPFKLVETKKKSLNGWFIEVECSIEHKDIIVKDMLCVIQTKSKLRPQAFRINALKVTSRKIAFRADHVMFDGERYFLDNVRPTNMSAIGALNYIDDRSDNDSPFSYTSNVSSSNTAYFIRKNLLEAWLIMEEYWHGVFDADNFEISFNIDSPIDKGATLNYGVDLQGVEVIEDWSGVVTKLYPTGYDGIMLPEKFLLSEIEYQQPYTKTVHFESEFEEDEKTPENLIPELRANAKKYMLQNEVPRVSYTVKSDVQQDLNIGDLIVVRHPVLILNTQVQEYSYDVISKKVKTLIFGNYSRDVKKKFGEVKDLINKTVEKISVTEALVSHQTNIINSLNKNGFVYIDDNEILILDKLPKENASNVWRFGMGGLGFSPNGYEGPYVYAFTQDGRFNASFIGSGEITTNMLSSDVGSSLDISSNNAINMEVANREAGDEFVKSSLEQTINDFNIKFQKEIEDQNGKVELITSYFEFSEDGLEIGKSDSDFSIRQTNEGIDLNYKGTPISSWKIVKGVPQMNVTALIVLESIIMGNHVIMKHRNANEAKSGTIWQHTRKIG